jgi:hypothetical protein
MKTIQRVSSDAYAALGGCGCVAIFAAIGLTIGGLAFQYSLWAIFGKDIPWYADALCGVVLGAAALPLAFILWILSLCGIAFPLVH